MNDLYEARFNYQCQLAKETNLNKSKELAQKLKSIEISILIQSGVQFDNIN